MTDKMSMVLMKSRFKKITGVLAPFSLDHSTAEPKAVCVLGLLAFLYWKDEKSRHLGNNSTDYLGQNQEIKSYNM